MTGQEELRGSPLLVSLHSPLPEGARCLLCQRWAAVSGSGWGNQGHFQSKSQWGLTRGDSKSFELLERGEQPLGCLLHLQGEAGKGPRALPLVLLTQFQPTINFGL